MKNKTNKNTLLSDRLRAFRGIDLNLFIIFASIYEHSSLTLAGQTLGLTQPAVSHALARLRDSLKDDLFVRKGSSVAPTPYARRIIGDVHLALDVLRSGPLGEDSFDASTSTLHFQISMTASMEVFLLPRILKQLEVEAPNVTISTTRVNLHDVNSLLASGELSLAIDLDTPTNTDLGCLSLIDDHLVTVTRKGNPLIENGKLSAKNYLKGKHILVATGNINAGPEDYELARIGEHRYITARCVNLNAALQTIPGTDYLLTLGRRQLSSNTPVHNLAIFDFPFSAPRMEALLFWHKSLDKDLANMWLRGVVSKQFT